MMDELIRFISNNVVHRFFNEIYLGASLKFEGFTIRAKLHGFVTYLTSRFQRWAKKLFEYYPINSVNCGCKSLSIATIGAII